jgi:hypothetical protein
MPAILRADVPAFVSVTLCAAEVVPTAVEAKVRLWVLNVTKGVAVPVPLSVTV